MHTTTRLIMFPVLFVLTFSFFRHYIWWLKLSHADRSIVPIPNLNGMDTKQFRKMILNFSIPMRRVRTPVQQLNFNVNQESKIKIPSNYQHFLIDTNTCKIPAIHPFQNGDFKYTINGDRFKCPGLKRLTRVIYDKIELIEKVNKKYFGSKVAYCILQLIRRTNDIDNHFEYDLTIVFNKSAIFNGEFCIVKCYSKEKVMLQIDFHSRIYEKTEVKSKILRHNWKESSLNVHLIGIDSMSRNSFIRQMPSLREFILKNMSAYEYPGFTKVGYNTLPNIIPLLTGKHLQETNWEEHQSFDHLDYIWKKYSDRGAVSLLAEDRPRTGAFNFRKKGFVRPPTDYYIRPLTLAIASEKSRDSFCIGSISETSYILKYTKDFLDRFNDKFYFAFNFFTDWSHDHLNGASRWEGAILDFFLWLQRTGKLNNTLLFFFSDHGFQMGRFRHSTSGKYESNLPFAFLVVPQWFKKKFPTKAKALKINQHRLVTFFDVYATLIENLETDDSSYRNRMKKHVETERNISLMKNITSNRTCQMAGIPLLYCQCIFQKEKMDVNHRLVRKAALAMVESMNKIIKMKAGGKCAVLSLKKLIHAYKDSVHSRYLITFSVLPSNGQFESIAWLPSRSNKFEVLTDAIRVNAYGKQSHCVKDLRLIMICYCI